MRYPILRGLRAPLLAALPILGLAAGPLHAAGPVQGWLTTADGRHRLEPISVPASPDDAAPATQIAIDAGRRGQRIVGFGASLTDASAWLLQTRLSPEARQALLRELFGREGDGLGLSFSRLTIGASDFSRHHYSLDDPPDGRPDPQLRHFSIAPNRDDVIPVARAMLAINPDLKIMASPWSAPAWMKDNRSLIQGTLDPHYHDAFARYLLRYVDAYRAEGIPIFALTVQNEPDFEPEDYPGMRLNAPARARFIGEHLGPLLAARKDAPLLLDWDHNWDKPEEPLAVLRDPKAGRYVDAVAWHCYAGEPSAQAPVHAAFPDKDAYMTECSGGTWEPIRSGGLTLIARRMLIEPVRNWARGVLFWNLALDENRGPHAGGCDTCHGVVTLDSRDGRVTRNDEYYVLGHASRFVRPGAWRIDSGEGGDGIANVAFLNPDDGSRVLLLANQAMQPRRIEVEEGPNRFSYTLPARSVATFVWRDGDRPNR